MSQKKLSLQLMRSLARLVSYPYPEMKIIFVFIASSFTSLTHALTAPPISFIDNSTLTSLTGPVPPVSRVECDGGQFGIGLRVSSCVNAWAKIIQDIEPHLYVPRGAREGVFKLPFRYVSGEFLVCK